MFISTTAHNEVTEVCDGTCRKYRLDQLVQTRNRWQYFIKYYLSSGRAACERVYPGKYRNTVPISAVKQ